MSTNHSWLASANTEHTHFPLQNLPFGVFSIKSAHPRCAVAIGDCLVDLGALEDLGLINAGLPVFNSDSLNAFMALGSDSWRQVRQQLTDVLIDTSTQRSAVESAMHAQADVTMHLPFAVTEYTDFYAGRHHATNVGTMLRGHDQALSPNWLHMPIAYNGRASTVVVSGTDIRRPLGQLKPPTETIPYFGHSRRLDLELEMGAVIGTPNTMGRPVTVSQADEMIFGYVLLNDWSARDIQAWEYQPLGPFQAKAFATSISPWVVTRTALEPYRCSTPERELPLLPYLRENRPLLYDIDLEVRLITSGDTTGTTITRTNYNEMYYSAAQQVCHHAIGGCKMRTGDLLGSGTISGPQKNQRGSLLELSWGGKEPLTLDNGEQRAFLQDGDTIVLSGFAKSQDAHRIGFGECRGMILPAIDLPKWT